MSDENAPRTAAVTPRGFSVGDLASPEVIRDRAITWAQAVSAEEAGANFRNAVRELRHHARHTAEELRQVADGIRAVAEEISEVPRG